MSNHARFLLVVAALSAGAGVRAAPDEGLRPVTCAFGIVAQDDGSKSVAVLDRHGSVSSTYPLGGDRARFGRGKLFTVIRSAAVGTKREVRILDRNFGEVGQLRIDVGDDVQPGDETVVVFPRADHARGAPFRLQLLGLDGAVLRTLERADLLLIDIEWHPGDHWVAYGANREDGRASVHLIDPRGRVLWELDAAGAAAPVVAVAPGGRAAVAVLQEDLRTSRLRLLDGSGAVRVSQEVPAVLGAVFAPDASRLLLVGRDALRLVGPDDGSVQWEFSERPLPAAGRSALFSADGSRLWVTAQERRPTGGPERLWLVTYTDLQAVPRRSARVLPDVGGGQRVAVLDLQPADGGDLCLLADRSVRIVRPAGRER